MRPGFRVSKRKQVRTPGGRLVWHRIKRKKRIARCEICGRILHGSRRNRAFGNMCSRCARKLLVERVRSYAEKG